MMTLNQKLLYSLEKAHRDTVGFKYDKRERVQDEYLRKALTSAGVKITERGKGNEPLVILALLYSLSCMDDDTYADLMRDYRISRSDLITKTISQFTTSITTAVMCECVIELTRFEINRVAAEHATSATTMNADAHEAKNFRFIIEMDALLKNSRFDKFFPDKRIDVVDAADDDNTFYITPRNADQLITVHNSSITGMTFRQALHLGGHWGPFILNLSTSKVTPAVLMTSTLIQFAKNTSNIKPLLDWQEALEKYYTDPHGLLPRTSKEGARTEFEKIQTWGENKTIRALSSHELTGGSVNFYRLTSSERFGVDNDFTRRDTPPV